MVRRNHQRPHLASVVAFVRRDLASTCQKRGVGFELEIVGNEEKDGWLHLFVRPKSVSTSAEDFVRVLAEVEMRTEDEFHGLQILLVPVSPPEERPARKIRVKASNNNRVSSGRRVVAKIANTHVTARKVLARKRS